MTIWFSVYSEQRTEKYLLWEIPGKGIYFGLGAKPYAAKYNRGKYDRKKRLISGIHELTEEELLVLVRGSTDEDIDSFLKAIDSVEAKPEPEPEPEPEPQPDTTVDPLRKKRHRLYGINSDGTLKNILTRTPKEG